MSYLAQYLADFMENLLIVLTMPTPAWLTLLISIMVVIALSSLDRVLQILIHHLTCEDCLRVRMGLPQRFPQPDELPLERRVEEPEEL